MRNRIINNPLTSAIGAALILLGCYLLYLDLDTTIAGTIITAGLAMLGAKDNFITGKNTEQ